MWSGHVVQVTVDAYLNGIFNTKGRFLVPPFAGPEKQKTAHVDLIQGNTSVDQERNQHE